MRTSASNRRLRLILTALTDRTLDPRPDFQRRLVWNNKDKVNFIKTVLDGFPFPEIYIAAGTVDPNSARGTELLVDGQQRMTTLHQYFLGSQDLTLGSTVPSYQALSDSQKLEFLEYEVVVRDLGNLPIHEIKRIFLIINSTSYGLNAMEIQNARYAGEFKVFCENLSQDPFFSAHRIFSTTEVRRMQDVKFCMVLVGTILGGYFNRDSEVELFLEKYNETFTGAKKLQKQIKDSLSFVDALDLSEDSRIFKKADLFTFLVELNLLPSIDRFQLDEKIVASRITDFYNHVDSSGKPDYVGDAASYHKASLQGTNDRSSRIERARIIKSILLESLRPTSYFDYLKTLNHQDCRDEISAKLGILIQNIVGTSEVNSEMTMTNTTGWRVDDYEVKRYELLDDEVRVWFCFSVYGDQDIDMSWFGDHIEGNACLVLMASGENEFTEISIVKGDQDDDDDDDKELLIG